ncbi:hypothetical protein MMC17_009868 [Xylographa soralifera]|nr:hypothetical protein [Xylographa soralifera]
MKAPIDLVTGFKEIERIFCSCIVEPSSDVSTYPVHENKVAADVPYILQKNRLTYFGKANTMANISPDNFEELNYQLGRSLFRYFIMGVACTSCKKGNGNRAIEASDFLFESFDYENCFNYFKEELQRSVTPKILGESVNYRVTLFVFLGSSRTSMDGLTSLFKDLNRFLKNDPGIYTLEHSTSPRIEQYTSPARTVHSSFTAPFPHATSISVPLATHQSPVAPLNTSRPSNTTEADQPGELSADSFETTPVTSQPLPLMDHPPPTVETRHQEKPSTRASPSKTPPISFPVSANGQREDLDDQADPNSQEDLDSQDGHEISFYTSMLQEWGVKNNEKISDDHRYVSHIPPYFEWTRTVKDIERSGQASQKKIAKHYASRAICRELGIEF